MGSGTGSPLIPPGRPRTRQESVISRPLIPDKLVSTNPGGIVRHLTSDDRYPGCALKMSAIKLKRAISTGKLNALPRLHIRPINVMVYHGS